MPIYFQTALYRKFKFNNNEPKEHWLDYAKPKYENQLVEDTKILVRVLVLFIPIPIFWTLFDQQVDSVMKWPNWFFKHDFF